jgi:hypothetical protein
MGEGSEKEVWSSEGWPRYFEVLVVLHSFGAGGAGTNGSILSNRVCLGMSEIESEPAALI